MVEAHTVNPQFEHVHHYVMMVDRLIFENFTQLQGQRRIRLVQIIVYLLVIIPILISLYILSKIRLYLLLSLLIVLITRFVRNRILLKLSRRKLGVRHQIRVQLLVRSLQLILFAIIT